MSPLLTKRATKVTKENIITPVKEPKIKPFDLCRTVHTNPETNEPIAKQILESGVATVGAKSFIVNTKAHNIKHIRVVIVPDVTPINICFKVGLIINVCFFKETPP